MEFTPPGQQKQLISPSHLTPRCPLGCQQQNFLRGFTEEQIQVLKLILLEAGKIDKISVEFALNADLLGTESHAQFRHHEGRFTQFQQPGREAKGGVGNIATKVPAP